MTANGIWFPILFRIAHWADLHFVYGIRHAHLRVVAE